MEELKESYSIEEYNDEPVFFCEHCLSLKIKIVGGYDFCDDCGSTAVQTAHIEDWEKMYQQRYGRKFLEENSQDYYEYLK
jgi:hypothetical protein